MENGKLYKLKNFNLIKSPIVSFTKNENSTEDIEKEKINKYVQTEIFNIENLSKKKLQNFSNKVSNLFLFKYNLNKNKLKERKKIENKLIKKKLILGESPKAVYTSLNKSKEDFTYSLNNKYKQLISNIAYNKRCFRNLSNADFDNLFFDNSNIDKDIKKKKILSKSDKKETKYSKINNMNKIYRITTDLNECKYNDFVNKLKNKIKLNCRIIRNNSTYHDMYKIKKNIFKNSFVNINHLNDNSKFDKFILLLKKQSEKNKNLLIDIKREETNSKEMLLTSMAKFEGYKAKKFILY